MTREKEVILIKQFRHGIEKITLEIPSGMVDDGENPQAAAQRELLEETGFSANNFILLGKSHANPAINNNLVYHYLALDCEKIQETTFDDHESVVTNLVSLDSVDELIAKGEITHSLVIAAFLWLRLKK
ncbi:MAG: NUDIX hydrolase [Acidobacteria bacterium]|nr:NUDIX hydrolase [Acidobacteriota bacterium]